MTISFEQRYDDHLDHDVGTPKRRRRRWVGVAIVGLVGLVLSAAWAAGILTTGTSPSAAAEATVLVGPAPASDGNALAGALTAGTDTALPINFTGKWGSIPDDAAGGDATPAWQLFEVNLGTLTGTYYVEVGVANEPGATSAPDDVFRVLQVQWWIEDADCDTADFTVGPGTVATSQLLVADTSDAVAAFSNLTAAGDPYCIGVLPTARANSETGTFIRRSGGDTTAPDPMPQFFAIIGRHST